ncbi:Predicted arabinose efflux permease, MFS family [Enhydrobacter aerosaccus]|uniref:Predicted arabinose efflux permease, MFS family n=1 Tax=Enhydrobacter aerosaccus TaxID=225324 RepID=A0A1T4RH45_9HYPH|nr:MFS transporter [Enhydrobacter aerosaccus]SKA15295.1 Predicted arabinose efflux permease, MFS family [Enhydrobacter aerosaccus]
MTRTRIFAGWWVVAGAFLCMSTGFAIVYSFAAFFSSLEAEFGAQRGETSLVFSISAFLYFFLGLPAGLIGDRVGPRPVVIGGLLVVALGLVAAAGAHSLWQVYLGYGLGVGVGVGFSYVPSVAAVQRWFVRRRGTASGIAVAGIGVGTLIGAPLAHELIAFIGWRQTYLVLAGITAVGAIVSGLLVRPDPHLYDLAPDGDPPTAGMRHRPAGGIVLSDAARTGPFWAVYASALLMSFGLFVPFVHLVPYARDLGLSTGFGVILITLLGVGSTVGRFLFAAITPWLGRRLSFATMLLGAGSMSIFWSFSTNASMLVIFSLLFGAFYGGFVAIAPSLAADYFGGRSLGAIIGALYSGVGIGALFGSPAAGYAYDFFGSYKGAILGGAFLCFIAFAIMLMAPEPAKWLAKRESSA